MRKDIVNKTLILWNKLLKRDEKNDKAYYVIGLFVLALIILQGFYLWRNNKKVQPPKEQELLAKEVDGLTISSAQKDNLEKFNKEIHGTNDSGFEINIYKSTKNVITKNAIAKISEDQFHTGKHSLEINWGNGQNKSVRLNNYLTTQKNKYYKIGLWISSPKDSHFKISLTRGDKYFPIAEVGVIASIENEFKYYEYNFRSPEDLAGLEFFVSNLEPSIVFIDDIRLIPLAIEKEDELAHIRATIIGNNQEVKKGEEQLSHQGDSDALSFPNTLIGQIFIPQKSDLVGASFAFTKRGDGGIGDYTLEIREFNNDNQTISLNKIAVESFSSKDITSENKYFPIVAKLEVGKKYWLGFNNKGVNVSNENHLAIGQADNNRAYLNGDGFLIQDENKIFTEENDLYFTTSYLDPIKIDSREFAYSETLYDLGREKDRLDYQLDSAMGNNILDIQKKQNISVDKWKNILLNEKDSYLVYKIKANEKNIDKLILNNIIFHNNINLFISRDGDHWTEIFSDNSGVLWQNSGKIEVNFKNNKPKNIFIKLKKNGEGNSVFIGGSFVVNATK
ncbi:MAG: hypothetical protein ACD_7C00348G0011 [uncultured bacterium]|nr:MAG: hypothetical protein ACD_7C00348G0011 [uncultured bacterium]HBR79949.1 hypothetical protein [Candidatus Moranbacteria bacterium]